MEKVLITGGSGLVGGELTKLLLKKGYQVVWLSRSKKQQENIACFQWDINKSYIDEAAFENVSHIIHLAGAGIADKRWTEKRKQQILFSRVASTELLLTYVTKLNIPLQSFVSSSAIGYYGSITTDKIFTEEDKPNDDFISIVCQKWEKAIFSFQKHNYKTVAVRTGIVLSKKGGALQKMKTPIITPLASGKQFMPWIHIDDLCEIYCNAIQNNNYKGVYNAVSPEFINNRDFSKKLAKEFNKPYLGIAAPVFILKLVLGKMATILIHGSRVSSQKIISQGFKFKFTNLNEALKNLR